MRNEDHPRLDSSDGVSAVSSEARANGKLLETTRDKSSSTIEVASSTCASGEVKVILKCNAAFGNPKLEMPSLDAVVKLMEDKCVNKYKDVDPKFSVLKVIQDVCQCFLELGSEATRDE